MEIVIFIRPKDLIFMTRRKSLKIFNLVNFDLSPV